MATESIDFGFTNCLRVGPFYMNKWGDANREINFPIS